MELKEFIKTAITDITEAVGELQDGLNNGTIVKTSDEQMRENRTKHPAGQTGRDTVSQ